MPNKGPYEMHPGENSKPSKYENVNFRDSDLKKAAMFPNMYPQNFNAARVAAVKAGKDSFKVGDKEFKVTSKAGAEMHHPGMYPMDHKNADGTHKAKEIPMRKSSNVINLGSGRAIGNLDLRSQKPSDQKDIIVSKPKKYMR
tara:strand:+ start:70 stop:495 length:426 start_codon:yes stop_codon:yes gene_type:complete